MKAFTSRLFNGIPVGLWIRRDICTTWIYRVRRGNGFYGTKVGERIQDKYPYFVPRSIKNPEGQASRDAFKAAVLGWQALSNEAKAWWDKEVQRLRLWMSGYNLYIRKYMKENL